MSLTDDLKPGEARCPGHPSTKEDSYQFVGDEDIPYDRYTSEEFANKEEDHLWSKVWQWACREEHIPEPGDYYVYDVGDRSALIVRTEENEIKAYFNSCLHRGTQLKPSNTNGVCKELKCPFHGWTWSLKGEQIGRAHV